MRTVRNARKILVLVLTVTVLAGCKQLEPIGRIRGRVTFQGKPVTEGLVVFSNTQKGVFMTAAIDKDRNYVVTSAAGPGIPLGQYQVTVTPPIDEPKLGPNFEPPPIKSFPNIPGRYRDVKTSDLSLEVKEGDNLFNVQMKP